MFLRNARRILCALLLSASIIGCGSDNNSFDSSVLNSQSSTTLSGQAARGAGISGANVTIRDGNGRVVFTTTDGSGAFNTSIPSGQITPPFVVEVRGGTYRPAGGNTTNNDLILHSFSLDGGRINVTTLTELVFAGLFQSTNTTTTFGDFGVNGNLRTRLTQANVDAIVQNVRNVLATRQLNGQLLAALIRAVDTTAFADFFRTPFLTNGQGPDAVLDLVAGAGNFTTINAAFGTANFTLPNPGNNTGGNSTGTTIYTVAGGNVVNFNFTPGNGYNGKNPPATGTFAGTVATNSTNAFATLGIVGINGTLDTLNVGIVVPTGNLTIGKAYPIASAPNTEGSLGVLSYANITTQVANPVWTIGNGTTGNVTLVTLNNTTVEMKFDISNLVPDSLVTNNTARGSFSMSGQWKGNVSLIVTK